MIHKLPKDETFYVISVNVQVPSISDSIDLTLPSQFVGSETITNLIIYLLRHVFHFQSLCYDLFSTSFELQLVKHLRFKMTNTTMFRNAVFGLKALFLDDNPPSLRKGFSLAKRAFFTQEMLFSC